LLIVRLSPLAQRKPFLCGDPDLDEFFHNDSKDHSAQLLAVTYAVENETETFAYFSVLNDNISRKQLGTTSFERFSQCLPNGKRYPSHPAVKVGRFAVAEKSQGQGLGSLLMDGIKVFFISKNKTGCRFITVDATKKAIGFYKKNGFIFLTDKDKNKDLRIMYFDLKPYADSNKIPVD